MAKLYYVRHQAAGIVYEFPFSQPPSEKQQRAVARFCFQKVGRISHEKTPDKPYWTRIVEVELLGPDELPDVPERVLTGVTVAGAGKADAGEVTANGTGHVEVLTQDDVGEMPASVIEKA
jgi:hypothetical protein